MSCNITCGIPKNCNGQVGGIVGIHYTQWYPDLVFEKDANGVVVRVYRESLDDNNLFWRFIEADNGLANVTETYNVSRAGSILGFHQAANFFLPTTAVPGQNDPSLHLQEFIAMLSAQNNMVIGIETRDNLPLAGYSAKSFVFGNERPAYTAGGNKQTGITYTDNNGYSIELGADSKEPMNEMAYWVMHAQNINLRKLGAVQPDYTWTVDDNWDFEKITSEGGNIQGNKLLVQPGELLTVEATIIMNWNANAFSGSTFLPTWFIDAPGTPALQYVDSLPTGPGTNYIKIKGTYENTSSQVQAVTPVKMSGIPTGVNICDNDGSDLGIPQLNMLTMARTTNSYACAPAPPTTTTTTTAPPPVAYYFHLGIGTYPYTQDLIGGTWYKHDNTIAANFADGFADALANPSYYETIDTIDTPLVDGYRWTYETSMAQNFYWLLIPDAWGIPDLTLEGHLRDVQNPVADVAAAKLATTVNGQPYTLYKLNLLSTIQPVTIEYVV